MSIFDPQQLYYHHQKSTRHGQVLQKKPQTNKGAISRSDIPRAISILQTYGYYVSPHPPPPVPPQPSNYNPKGASVSGHGYIELDTYSNVTLSIQNIYNQHKNDASFSSLRQIPLDSIQTIDISFYLLNIDYSNYTDTGYNVQLTCDAFIFNVPHTYEQLIFISELPTTNKYVGWEMGFQTPVLGTTTKSPIARYDYVNTVKVTSKQEYQQLEQGTYNHDFFNVSCEITNDQVTVNLDYLITIQITT